RVLGFVPGYDHQVARQVSELVTGEGLLEVRHHRRRPALGGHDQAGEAFQRGCAVPEQIGVIHGRRDEQRVDIASSRFFGCAMEPVAVEGVREARGADGDGHWLRVADAAKPSAQPTLSGTSKAWPPWMRHERNALSGDASGCASEAST